MKTLTISASRLLRYHETKGLPCFAADIIGQGSFVSLDSLDRVYSELCHRQVTWTATESKGKVTLPDGEEVERRLYVVTIRYQ